MAATAAPERWPVAVRAGAVRQRRSFGGPRLEPRAVIPIDLPVDLGVVLE